MSECAARLPYDQLQSFVRHDLYAPTAMLKHFLQSMLDLPMDAESIRETLGFALGLTSDLAGLLQLLGDALQVGTAGGEGESVPLQAVHLGAWMGQLATELGWLGSSEQAHYQSTSGGHEVLLEEGAARRALQAIVYQWSRMGNQPGRVELRLAEDDPSKLQIFKPVGSVPLDVLGRALRGDAEDWGEFLRKLPACGLPLRVARGLLADGCGAQLCLVDDPQHGPILTIAFWPAS